MKTLATFFLMVLMVLGLAASGQTVQLPLGWNYSTNDPANSFLLWTATNVSLPLSQWTLLTNVNSTNCYAGGNQFTNTVTITAAQEFLFVQTSNIWGLSSNSIPLAMPTPPVPVTHFVPYPVLATNITTNLTTTNSP